jgi:alpha-tubulin suppressor-like RCC1 family protein
MLGRLSLSRFSKLYTWGGSASSLGHEKSTTTTSIALPKLLEVPEPIQKCVLGPNHSAILAQSGALYTFGGGAYGALGHDSEDKCVTPTKIASLSKLEIKAKDVALGNFHTVILTTEGEVWTMGFGGQLSGGWLRSFISQKGGGLGHGDLADKFVPSAIVSLKEHEDIVQVSAGTYHSMALGASGSLYVWGKGEMGVLGTGKNRNYLSPLKNPFFEGLLSRGYKVKKIATCNYSNIVLMENGKLLCWGWNEVGQLALGNYARADMYDTERTPLEPPFFADKVVKDFRLGEECSMFLTEDNKLYYAGIRLHREPKELHVPEGTGIRDFFACRKVGGYITGIQ